MGLNQSTVGMWKNNSLITLHLLTGQVGRYGTLRAALLCTLGFYVLTESHVTGWAFAPLLLATILASSSSPFRTLAACTNAASSS